MGVSRTEMRRELAKVGIKFEQGYLPATDRLIQLYEKYVKGMTSSVAFEELKVQAEQLGFIFELQTWEFDDYTLDDEDKECWYKGTATQFKVTFPRDWPRGANYMEPGDVLAVQRALEEYQNRHQIRAEDERRSRENIDAVRKLSEHWKSER